MLGLECEGSRSDAARSKWHAISTVRCHMKETRKVLSTLRQPHVGCSLVVHHSKRGTLSFFAATGGGPVSCP